MSYKEIISNIRSSRNSRDELSDHIYALQLEYISLKRKQKQAETKEITTDDKTLASIQELRDKLAELRSQIREAETLINRLAGYRRETEEKEKLKYRIAQDLKEKRSALLELNNEINSGNIPDERKLHLLNARDVLKTRTEDIYRKFNLLEKEIQDLNIILQNYSEKQLTDRRALLLGRTTETDRELAVFIQNNTTYPKDLSQVIKRFEESIAASKKQETERENNIREITEQLYGQKTPMQLIGEWNDKTPILLLPLRMETKFKLSGTVKELWVRVFPDDIAIETHEKILTQTEVEYGTSLWKNLWHAQQDESHKEAAWKVVTDKFGVNRAGWVALQTKPDNWGQRTELTNEDDLIFPDTEPVKPSSWTKAPQVRTMPDKLVLLPFKNGKALDPVIGKQIKDVVVVGPAPIGHLDKPSVTRNEDDSTIDLGQDFVWVRDFDKAVEEGLGFKVRLDDDTAKGFDKLLVVGLKLSADEGDGKALLENLLHSHQYSVDGLSLIKQGTPTNNTEEKDAGYSAHQTVEDIRKRIENDDILFSETPDLKEATDGQRMADLLGIEYSILQPVINSDLKDHQEAVAINKALYAGTLGYYCNSMLNDVMEDTDIQRLRNHFTGYVTGRGPLASIRAGNQPYGILITSAFDKWKTPVDLVRKNPEYSFLKKLHQFLSFMESEWRKKISELPQISKAGNSGENLMKVLGLHPVSTEFYQRVGYSFDHLKNLEAFSQGGKYFSDVFKMTIEKMFTRQLLKNFDYDQNYPNGSPKPVPLLLQLIFQNYHVTLDKKNFVDTQELSEEGPNNLHYLSWLLNNASDIKKLEAQDFGSEQKPNTLLYMMLLNSMLLESGQSIYKYLSKRNIVSGELIRSRKFMNISTAPSVSQWEIFQAPVNRIIATETSSLPLYSHIRTQFTNPAENDSTGNLKDQMWALEKLKDISTAGLERALTEHIDILSYRLDAWQTSLFYRRLQEQRNLTHDNTQRHKGIYIGSFGYLENVFPGRNRRKKVSENILPDELKTEKDNLYTETENGGYVHAPTLNHATAAALLRNGYLTHADPENKELLAVNLSSERVRRAKHIIDGIRNGQTLEVLLGYQFERGLHDWSSLAVNPVILNHLKPNFRQAFPLKKTKIPQEGKVTGPEETVNDFHVVNGLALAKTKTAFPYGITTFPALSEIQINAIKKEKENLENSLDSLKDVLTAESAYQLALGNFDRAAAVLQAISGGLMPPEVEVIQSARGTDMVLTNRVVIHFDSTLTENPWPLIPLTQKALTEPGLNYWLGTLIGDPEKIKCRVAAVDGDGNILRRTDDTEIVDFVTLQDLALQPVDFMYLIRNRLQESGPSELEARVRYVFAGNNFLSDRTVTRIEFSRTDAENDPEVKSFAEILPLVNHMRNLVSSSRPVLAKDYLPASKELVSPENNENNIDLADFQARVQNAFNNLNLLASLLLPAIEDADSFRTEAFVNNLRNKIKSIADAGFPYTFPQSSFGHDTAQTDLLVTQGRSVLKRINEFRETFNKKIAEISDPGMHLPDQKVSVLTELIKSILGEDFVILPRFSFINVPDITQAYNSRSQLLNYTTNSLKIPLVVSEWLHGISLVRPKMHTLEFIRLLNDTFNPQLLSMEPIQLPYRANDTWLAVDFPSGTTIDHDTISLIQYNPQGFEPAKSQCGLLIDDWTEVIPNKDEVTGITFNFDQPDSMPPQLILLAVTPEETGSWKWENLVSTITDTIERAKARAVEPDHIDKISGISTLLPATHSEFSTGKNNLSLDYSLNIKLIYNEVSSLINKI